MSEKKKTLRCICLTIGLVSLVVYLIFFVLSLVEKNDCICTMRIIVAGIATIAYTITLGVEISDDSVSVSSILLIAICLYQILITAMQLFF